MGRYLVGTGWERKALPTSKDGEGGRDFVGEEGGSRGEEGSVGEEGGGGGELCGVVVGVGSGLAVLDCVSSISLSELAAAENKIWYGTSSLAMRSSNVVDGLSFDVGVGRELVDLVVDVDVFVVGWIRFWLLHVLVVSLLDTLSSTVCVLIASVW